MNNHNTSSRTIRLYQSPTKFFRANWPMLFGLLLFLPVFLYRRSKKRVAKVLSVLVAGPLLLFVSPFIPSFYRLLFRIPIVVINEEGISYNPGPVWLIKLGMSIHWEEIAELYINELTIRGKKRTSTNRLLAVTPKDEDAFFQREKILSLRRFPLWFIMTATKTPFMLFEQVIYPSSPENILDLITSQYQDKIQENGIEIREEQKTLYEGKIDR